MALPRSDRTHTVTVVVALAVVALIVASVSAALLWSVRGSQRSRGADRPARTAGPAIPVSERHRAPAAPEGTPPAARANCGAVQPWDSDGDGITDSVEENNREIFGFAPSTCDRDPSAPRGSPSGGRLEGGLNLRDRGAGYVHLRGTDPPDGDDWGTLRLMSCIEAVGRETHDLGLAIAVNDLSLRPGGRFFPHSSHQNGLDVDVRYLRRDGRLAPLDIRLNPGDYDPLLTQALLRSFLRHCDVAVMFVDLANLAFTNAELERPVLVQAPGHSNHFHVRLRAPS